MKAFIRGTEIYYDIAGMQLVPVKRQVIERPVIFLLHGGPGGDHLRFKQHSLEIQDAAQVVFIDHRGCGRSKKTKKADYTLENNIEDIEALRKHLGLQRISMLGTSYGGIVAQGYAIRYSKNIDKLILVATSPSFRFIEEAKIYIRKHGTPQQIAYVDHLWHGTFKNSKQVADYFKVMESLYSTEAKRKHISQFGKLKTIWSHEALNKGFSGFLKHYDFIPYLKKITCQTLILAGDKDWICSPNQAKILAKKIPRSKLKIFKNCSHAIAVDAHKDYIKTIQAFLRRK